MAVHPPAEVCRGKSLPNAGQELWRRGDISNPIATSVCLPSLLPSLLTAEHQSPC